jgi:hypothetical protein
MELPLVCPYCWDQRIELVPDARLYAENFHQQQAPIPASVFHCRNWHIFATFPLETRLVADALMP